MKSGEIVAFSKVDGEEARLTQRRACSSAHVSSFVAKDGNGRYQAYLACAPQLWQETAQITWLKEAVDSYAYPLAGLVLEFSADAEFKASHPVWEQAGFKVEDRVRYLMIRSLRTA